MLRFARNDCKYFCPSTYKGLQFGCVCAEAQLRTIIVGAYLLIRFGKWYATFFQALRIIQIKQERMKSTGGTGYSDKSKVTVFASSFINRHCVPLVTLP